MGPRDQIISFLLREVDFRTAQIACLRDELTRLVTSEPAQCPKCKQKEDALKRVDKIVAAATEEELNELAGQEARWN